ncbi:MAG: hypothetical protein BroJett003_01240 [Planctomycetota bacterium]|nr:MAG: hypothetical protein BroJett003_01240 [Planctomycetota bacterium]
MTDTPNLNQLFGGLHRQLESELGIARETIDHSGTKGTVTEDRWIEMLRKHLPERYRVNRAFVIDSKDGASQQQDIVIHDRQYSPFVLNLGGALYVPAESVYAVLEVKQNLNAGHIEYAADKIASVRRLHRTSLPIKHAGGEYPAKPPHYILGGLVTLESDWSPPLGDAFRKALAVVPADGRLDMGCAVRHGVFSVKYSTNEPPAIAAEQSACSLALFLLRFIASLQTIATVPCIDVLAYAANIRSDCNG